MLTEEKVMSVTPSWIEQVLKEHAEMMDVDPPLEATTLPLATRFLDHELTEKKITCWTVTILMKLH